MLVFQKLFSLKMKPFNGFGKFIVHHCFVSRRYREFVARKQVAVLDYTAHLDRPFARNEDGTVKRASIIKNCNSIDIPVMCFMDPEGVVNVSLSSEHLFFTLVLRLSQDASC